MTPKEKEIETLISKQRSEWGKLGAKRSKENLRKRAEKLIEEGKLTTG